MAAQGKDGVKSQILIYGAYGYTGRLCCEEAARKELDFIVGGVSGSRRGAARTL